MLYYSEMVAKTTGDEKKAFFKTEKELFDAERKLKDKQEEKALKQEAEKLAVDDAFENYINAKQYAKKLSEEASEMINKADMIYKNARQILEDAKNIRLEAKIKFDKECDKYLQTHNVYENNYDEDGIKEHIKRTKNSFFSNSMLDDLNNILKIKL